MRHQFFFTVSTAAALFILAGCTVGPDYKPPHVDMPSSYGEQSANPTTQASATTLPSRTVAKPPSLVEWWTTFNDSELNDLISRALSANLDVKLAQARVREARAERAVITGTLYPDVNVSASYQHARTAT